MPIIKYTFDVPVVAMVSHILAKSRMAVNYVTVYIVDLTPSRLVLATRIT